MDDLFIVDAHEDIAFHLNYFERDFVNPEIPCMITLPGLNEAGIRLVFNTIFVHPKHRPGRTVEKAKAQVKVYEEIYEKFGDTVSRILNKNDLEQLLGNKKIGFLTLMEGADPIEKISDLGFYYNKGLRILGPAWNNKNKYASGPETDSGLSKDGKKLIAEMNRLSITLDLSHLNKKCFWEAIELTDMVYRDPQARQAALSCLPEGLNPSLAERVNKAGARRIPA